MAPPPPLTTELLNQAMVELGPGSSHAVKACFDCYTKKSMSGADLISFIKSISSQSATLRKVFAPPAPAPAPVKPTNQVASADDFAFLMAAFGNAPPKAAPVAPPKPVMGESEVLEEEEDEEDECCHAEVACKRKRTQTLNGEGPTVDGEDDAVCPVCRDCPREDDRWVKCDGCSSWYHQICVLFNEQAHGKSVRFFCRTPGCRKRGSRQLNRRQRKPCYPTSTELPSSALGDYLCAVVAPVARSDRPVLVRLAAHVRRQGQGGVVVHNKTLLAFQHTLTGSDLVLMAMFVEETRMADGTAHAEVTRIDTNGLYEESHAGEREQVEHAIIQGYLQHVSHAGFASVSFPSGSAAPLFHGLAASVAYAAGVWTCSLVQEVLGSAHRSGLVHSVVALPRGSWLVQLRAPGYYARVAPEEDAERDTLALSQDDWLEAQVESNYSFDALQFAKYSSMMLVYHLIKGWERGAAPPRSPPPLGRLAPALDGASNAMDAIEVESVDNDTEEHFSSPEEYEPEPAPKRRRAMPADDAWANAAPAQRSPRTMDDAPPPPPMMPALSRQSSWGPESCQLPTLQRESSWDPISAAGNAALRRSMSASLEPSPYTWSHAADASAAPPPPLPTLARESSWGPEENYPVNSSLRRSMSASLEPYERATAGELLACMPAPPMTPIAQESAGEFGGMFGGMFLDVAPTNEDSLWDSFLAGM
ncbi:hypothetical protein T484DRAFT_2024046 [Baffinella frigidus]|nr:hypothetical protein T484DRAFT_2024046 [Cryptophyta sp. CCMP2293]